MRKKIVGFIFSMLLVSTNSFILVSASPEKMINESMNLQNENSVVTYADSIIVKYRKYNGKKQYRTWNETRQCWVDPYWITL